MSIYQEIILDHYRFPRHKGTLPKPTHHAMADNPLCGDHLEMDILMADNGVKEIAFSGQGCAISQASASMLSEYAVGKSNDELLKLDSSFITEMLGIELEPNGIKCAVLSLETLQRTLPTPV